MDRSWAIFLAPWVGAVCSTATVLSSPCMADEIDTLREVRAAQESSTEEFQGDRSPGFEQNQVAEESTPEATAITTEP